MLQAAILVVALGWADADSITEDLRPHSRATVEGTVASMIDLLEAKEYRPLFEQYLHPDDLKDLQKTSSIDELLKKFPNDAELLLQDLRRSDLSQLEYNDDRTEAVYHVPEQKHRNGPSKMRFSRIDGKWYIRNH